MPGTASKPILNHWSVSDCAVLLRKSAASCIARETLKAGNDRETGGLLFGHLYEKKKRLLLVVERTSGPGPHAKADLVSLKLDPEHKYRMRREAGRKGLVEVGGWHSHPWLPAHSDKLFFASAPSQYDFEMCRRVNSPYPADYPVPPASFMLITYLTPLENRMFFRAFVSIDAPWPIEVDVGAETERGSWLDIRAVGVQRDSHRQVLGSDGQGFAIIPFQ